MTNTAESTRRPDWIRLSPGRAQYAKAAVSVTWTDEVRVVLLGGVLFDSGRINHAIQFQHS
eukprot:3370644-Pyramimonas_sp.AAC.1